MCADHLELWHCGEDEHDDGGEEEEGADNDENSGGRGGVWILEEFPDDAPQTGTHLSLKMVHLDNNMDRPRLIQSILFNAPFLHLILLVDPVIHDGKEPGRALQGVGAAGLCNTPHHQLADPLILTKVQGTQPPVLQLPNKIFWADAFSQMELSLAVKAEDVLKYSRRPVKIKLPAAQRKRVA